MLGQPASSQTVCSPSRRTSDFSSVYSGPVLSRVLIHSGLRSIGTWLLRTSRRRSLRPPGPIGEPGSVVGTAVSVMIPTVPRTRLGPGPHAGVPGPSQPICSGGVRRRGGLAVVAGGAARGVLVVGRLDLARRRLRGLHAEVGVGRRRVAGGVLGVGDRLAGVAARGAGHGVLSVAGHGAVAGRGRGPGVLAALQPAEHGEDDAAGGDDGEGPRPAARLLLDADLALDLGRGLRRLLLQL